MLIANMEDLSLHILDVVDNSIDAGAQKVEIKIYEDLKKDLLEIEIIDDGKGMGEGMVKKALDPFFTTKTVRKVGLGLSLFREAARMANGDLSIRSEAGRGTRVKAAFQHSHIDRKPLGDIGQTMITLVMGNPEIDLVYIHKKNGNKCCFDTIKLKTQLKGKSINSPDGMRIFKENLKKMQKKLIGGK